MIQPRGKRERLWWAMVAAVGGLLLAILVAGLAGFLSNRNVKLVTDEALLYDVELEDHGDDLRVAVLDVRQYHRNLLFQEPTKARVADHEEAYAALQQEMGALENLGVRDPDAPQPQEIREMAEAYYAEFRPAIDLYGEDPAAFEEASDRGLERIAEMDAAAAQIDKLGERLTSNKLAEVDRASSNATMALAIVMGGLLLIGTALAYLAVRVAGELRAASERLAEAARAKNDFLADVSHELRTPLTVLRGNAEMGLVLDRDWPHRRLLEEIMKESGRMTRMVEDLLFLSRSDSAAVPLEKKTVPVADLLAETAGRATTLARERGARLHLELSGDGDLAVDQRRVEQAVLILVDNAAKYGPPGGRVRLASETAAGELRLTVADEGPGIPEGELPKIFGRFYRLDKARSRRMGGAGLGLPIAKAIVEAHGGRMEAQSSPGEGTRMTIRLPISYERARRDGHRGIAWR